MASLVCRWLKTTDPAPAAGAATPAAAGAAAGGGGVGQAPARQRLDEAFYLRQLAKERFDPQLFATVFTSGGSGAPGWLNGLIAEPGKRRLTAVPRLLGSLATSCAASAALQLQLPAACHVQPELSCGSCCEENLTTPCPAMRLLTVGCCRVLQRGGRWCTSWLGATKTRCCSTLRSTRF